MTHVSNGNNKMPIAAEVRGVAEGFSATTGGVTVRLGVGSAPEAVSGTVLPVSTMSWLIIVSVTVGTAEEPVEGPDEGDNDGATEGYKEGTVESVSETRGFVKTLAPPAMTAFSLCVEFSITIPPPEMTVLPPENIKWPGAVGTTEGAAEEDTEGMFEGDADGATEGRTEGAADVKLSCAQTAGATTARKTTAA
jgi:hypothetical protein